MAIYRDKDKDNLREELREAILHNITMADRIERILAIIEREAQAAFDACYEEEHIEDLAAACREAYRGDR